MITKVGNIADLLSFLDENRAELESSIQQYMQEELVENVQEEAELEVINNSELLQTNANEAELETEIEEDIAAMDWSDGLEDNMLLIDAVNIDASMDKPVSPVHEIKPGREADVTGHNTELFCEKDKVNLAVVVDTTQNNNIEMTWSTSLETPLHNHINTHIIDTNKTDTTFIMDQLCLNDIEEVDYGFDDALILSPLKEICENDLNSSKDSLDLDDLAFPSQFPNEFDEVSATDDDVEEVEEVKGSDHIDDNSHDDVSESVNSVQLNGNESIDFDLDLELPFSQFPTQFPDDFSIFHPETKETCDEFEEKKPESFGGFITGNGNKVPPPSKEALKRARSLVELDETPDEIDDYDNEMKISKTSESITITTFTDTSIDQSKTEIVGFSTGRGKLMPPPSDLAIQKAQALLAEVAVYPADIIKDTVTSKSRDEDPVPNMMLGGFSTGRGIAMKPPSESALKKAQKMINDVVDNENNNPNIIPMFSSGCGKIMPPPSESALRKAQLLINNVDDNSSVNSTNLVASFSTGRGKVMPPPSEEAVKKAQSIISDVEMENPFFPSASVSSGFSTGRGKSMPPPSEEALKKAQSLFGDVEMEIDKSADIINLKPPNIPLPPNPFKIKNPPFKPPSSTIQKPSTTTTVNNNASTSLFNNAKKQLPMSSSWKRPRQVRPVPAPVPVAASIAPIPISVFDLNVKDMKRYKLKDFFTTSPRTISMEEYRKLGIVEDILSITASRAKIFKFKHFNNWSSSDAFDSLKQHLKSLTLEWVENHYKWIVWKFASMIRSFPFDYSHNNLSPSWILQQLLYRYEREINLCQRSALKKIVERDDAAGKYMCLVVSEIDYNTKSFELSDGWYSIWTVKDLDDSIWELITKQILKIGCKIEICGASLVGEEAVPILEAFENNCRIKLCRNSMRPSKWDTPLGFIPLGAFQQHLHTIHLSGGSIPALVVLIERVYPILYKDESSVVRNERDHFAYINQQQQKQQQNEHINMDLDGEQQFEPAKITIFQRIKVISAINNNLIKTSNNNGNTKNNNNNLCGVITFWNPILENLMLLQEGSKVIITGLRTSTSTRRDHHNHSHHNLQINLISSKGTKIFKYETSTPTTNENSIAPRFKINCNQFDVFESLTLTLTQQHNNYYYNEIDFHGFVIGRSGLFLWIGGEDSTTDPKKEILVYMKTSNSLNVQIGDFINFKDISFNHFDSKLHVAHLSFTEHSDYGKERLSDNKKHTFMQAMRRFEEITK